MGCHVGVISPPATALRGPRCSTVAYPHVGAWPGAPSEAVERVQARQALSPDYWTILRHDTHANAWGWNFDFRRRIPHQPIRVLLQDYLNSEQFTPVPVTVSHGP